MLWFLGYVSQDDLKKNKYIPSFILKLTESNKWKFCLNKDDNLKKVLFKSVNDKYSLAAIRYVSSYSYRKSAAKGTTIRTRLILKGALFWFPCDRNGNQLQAPLFALKVPQRNNYIEEESKRVKSKNAIFVKDKVSRMLSHSPNHIVIDTTCIKPYFWSFECPTQDKYKSLLPKNDDVINNLFRA